jgi:predicted AAA+ superfamily ATPase
MEFMKALSDLKKIQLSLNGLVIFEDLLQDNRIKRFYHLLDDLTNKETDCQKIYLSYHEFYKSMVGINWVEYLVGLLFDAENDFIIAASRVDHSQVAAYIQENMARDLRIIQALAEVKPWYLTSLIASIFKAKLAKEEEEVFKDTLWPENWPSWRWDLPNRNGDETSLQGLPAAAWLAKKKAIFLQEFILQAKWEANVSLLLDYYREIGCGLFGNYAAFKITEDGPKLEGIANPDPIRISNLICQEREQSLVLDNTLSFLRGFPANNIILYGNRGTGKSSLVKALLNEYADKGLRLVQLKKDQIGCFPELVSELAEVPLKFIIFIDDLSFNDVEEDYKKLKSLLEGGVEARPDNVLIYATSNRRHLVKESFADRRSDDVHAQDNMEEKLSLADRFGITVTFLSPDQETYLKIVEGLAAQNKIAMPADELRQKALKWVMMHNGRSGRTARQFIDHLSGELALAKN